MKVIRFPGAAEAQRAGLAAGEEIDAMLAGEVGGAESLAVRALCEDVRALASPMSAEFERELQARVAEWAAAGRVRPRRGPAWPAALRGRLRDRKKPLVALGGLGTMVAAFIAVVVLVGGANRHYAEDLFSKQNDVAQPAARGGSEAAHNGPVVAAPRHHAAKAGPNLPDDVETGGGSTASSAAPTSAPAAPGRLQQLAAAVTLATEPSDVQSAAEATTRLAVTDGGYVESSHVQVRTGGASEAQLRLVVPSARLSSAIAALGRIAPERAVSQESEDITSAYDSARRRLGDAEAVRRALLRALEAASTQGRIESLREQLAANRSQISEYRSQVKAQAHRAATSKLEVTIAAGGAAAADGHEGLTLRRGLRDAGHVLAGIGAVGLIALAVLVPLAVVALAIATLRGLWLRRRREAVLDR
jgi:hypothetical protein